VSTLRIVETRVPWWRSAGGRGAEPASRWQTLIANQRFVDGALVVGCLFLAALAVKGHWSVLPRPVIAAAGIVGSAAQWTRRRQPHVATVAGAAAYALSGNPGPLLVGLYSGAAYAPRRHVWALAVVGAAGFAAWPGIDAGRLAGLDVATSVLVAAVVVAVGVQAATRRELNASLRERAERADAERALRDERARSAERTRIAREMHDVLAHKVSLIALHAGALELNAGGDPARARHGAALIRVTAREALRELRTVLGVLQAEPGARTQPDPEPFADLTSLVQSSTAAGQRVELHDQAGALPPDTARVVYRVAQEGLTNARKHAPDAPVTVSLDRGEDGTVTVTVQNAPAAGVAMDLPGAGSGLIGLAERLRLVGGSLHSGRDGDDGWQLRAVVPWLDGPGAS
jgi:signal transduction histidine kinase